MAAGPDDLKEAILRRPLTVVDPSMKVFRPRVWPLQAVLAALFLATLASAGWMIFVPAWYTVGGCLALAAVTFAWLLAALPSLSLAGRGLNTWAISATHLLYVNRGGRGTPVPLAAITRVALSEGGVPVISFDGTLATGDRAELSLELPGLAAPGIRGFFDRPTSPARFVTEVQRRLAELAPAAPLAELAPPDAALADLRDPIADARWEAYRSSAKLLERGRFGRYEVAFLDTRGVEGGMIRYTYRAMVFAPGLAAPVLSFNHERSAMGTTCWGLHKAEAHVNHGEAPVDVSYDAFRERAIEAIGEALGGGSA